MTLLSVVYASAPTDEVIIPTLEIQVSGRPPVRLCADFQDHDLGVDGIYYTFQACSLSIALPARNTSGQQNLSFALGSVDGQIDEYVDAALESGERVPLIYREYLASDKSAPARRPYTMVVAGGQFEGAEVQIDASFYDLLNAAWPRQRYTVHNAPGLKYL